MGQQGMGMQQQPQYQQQQVILSLGYSVISVPFLLLVWLFFFTYPLLAVVYVSHWLRIDFLTPLVCNLLSNHYHHQQYPQQGQMPQQGRM
jgi:hypothetical protein